MDNYGDAQSNLIQNNKTFQKSAPWYLRNDKIHKDLAVPTIIEDIRRIRNKHVTRPYEQQHIEVY